MWSDIVRYQMHDLELISSWAAQVNLGRVRDLIRSAEAELRHEYDRAIAIECERYVPLEIVTRLTETEDKDQ